MSSDTLSPYKGLRVFEDSMLDVPFFFGRERERGLVEANLMASRLTVLYGETGVGKSSLLRAGVAHHLRSVARANLAERGEPELAVVVFADWRDDPVTALGRACGEEVTRALGGSLPLPQPGLPLADALRGWQEILGGDLYVILDQMEEHFLYHESGSGAGTFAAEFPALVTSPDLRVNFLVAIREDALAKLDAFKARLPNVLGNYLRLEHLDVDAAREAIVRPVERYNELVAAGESVELEPELVDAILEQVAAGRVDVGRAGRGGADGGRRRDGRIETPYLQLVLQRLWDAERAAGSHTLRLATLEQLGGAARIVGDHVGRALTALTPPEQDIASAMFEHLVTPSGTKIAHAAPDLARYAGAGEPAVVSVLDKLGTDRIVRAVANGHAGGSRYEIFHDVLAEPVLAWTSAHEETRALAQQREDAERRHRRLLWITAVIGVALVAMATLAVFALVQRSEARSQARIAGARELAAQAVSELQVDPQHSLALAIASVGRARTSDIEDVLRQALIASRERAVLPSRGAVHAVAFSPDSSLVVTGADDGTARVWRRDGTLVRSLRQGGPVTAVSFDSSGRLVLTASTDGTARLWRTATGEAVAVFRHAGGVTGASFGSGFVVTSSTDGTARLWRTDGSRVLVVRQNGPVTGAALDHGAHRLVTIGGDRDGTNRRARIYSVPAGRLLHVLDAKGVTRASFSPDGRLLVTGSVDHTAAVFDVASGRRLHLFTDQQSAVTAALFGPGGRLVVTTSSDGATRVWNTRTGGRTALILGHANAVEGAAFSTDGRFLVTVSSDGTARVWEAATGRLEVVLRGHRDVVVAAAFSPDGTLVATASLDGTARLWDPGTEPELHTLAAFTGAIRAASYSPDGRLVLEAGDDGRARLLDASGRVVRVLRHPAPVESAVFSAAGKLVLTADARRTLRIWRVDDGALVRTIPGIAAGRLSAGSRVVLVPGASALAVLDAGTFERVRELTLGAPFTAAAVSPDGRTLATAGADGVARTWDAASGRPVRGLAGHKDALTDVSFGPGGRSIVTASRDHDARVWDVATGASTVLRGHFGPVFGASFSPDGRFVVTAGPITAGLWVASTGRFITYLRGHEDVLTGASFSPDGVHVLTSARDGTIRTYACTLCGDAADLVRVAEARLTALRRPLAPAAQERYLPAGTGGE